MSDIKLWLWLICCAGTILWAFSPQKKKKWKTLFKIQKTVNQNQINSFWNMWWKLNTWKSNFAHLECYLNPFKRSYSPTTFAGDFTVRIWHCSFPLYLHFSLRIFNSTPDMRFLLRWIYIWVKKETGELRIEWLDFIFKSP